MDNSWKAELLCGIPQVRLRLRIEAVGEIFKRPYRVRRAAAWGKEVTLAPEAPLCPGDEVIEFFDRLVPIVSRGPVVDESLLRRAIKIPTRSGKGDG